MRLIKYLNKIIPCLQTLFSFLFAIFSNLSKLSKLCTGEFERLRLKAANLSDIVPEKYLITITLFF